MRAALRRAEKELEKKSHEVPPELKQWLQLTYETEQMYFNLKKREAEKQLEQAREEVVNGTGVCVWGKEEYKWTDYTSA